MRIPTEWLSEYVDSGLSAGELAELLVRLGIEIEEIVAAPAGLGGEVLVAEITPNRGDCLSILGLAHEVAAGTGAPLKRPEFGAVPSGGASIAGRVTVELAAPDECPRYSAAVVREVRSGPSPEWLQRRLLACGQRPIDILVDVTNYVLFELGQPLHAFDHELLGDRIVVRRAEAGEVMVTLDDVKRTLTEEQLLITDGERAVALAGVMGGANTEVTERTRHVLLEAAHFHGPNIRRTARRLGLESESSYRFARHVDPNLTVLALQRACGLLAAHAGGLPAPGLVDVKAREFEPKLVVLRPERCNSFLGTSLSAPAMAAYLGALALGVTEHQGRLQVTVPTRRPDLEREVDLIEEIGRLHGYDKIAFSVPPAARRTGRLDARQQLERRLRELLLACGLNEVQTFSLTSPAAMARGGFETDLEAVGAVRLENPLSEDYSVLRWSMLPSMLEVVGRNLSLHAETVRVFELGRTYAGLDRTVTDQAAADAGRLATGRTAETLPLPAIEERTLAGALTGRVLSADWNVDPVLLVADVFDAKGVLDLVFEELRIDQVTVEVCREPVFASGRAGRMVVDGQVVAVFGEVAEQVRDRYDIRVPVVAFEANLGWLLDHADTRRIHRALPRQPAALRDLALVVPREVTHKEVAQVIGQVAGEWLEDLRLFDVYRGQGIPSGARSLAYSLRFRHPERTLTDAEVDRVIAEVIEAAGRELGASLRE